MAYLLDTNILLRLIGPDDPRHLQTVSMGIIIKVSAEQVKNELHQLKTLYLISLAQHPQN